jgi:hypothetical protein
MSEMEEYLEHNYFNTYYYSNIIDNILTGDIELVGFISDFFTDNHGFLKPFEKYSAFHQFIKYIIFRFMEEEMNEYDQKAFEIFKNHGRLPKLYIDELFERYNVSYEFDDFREDDKPLTYDDIESYHEELDLTGYKEELYEKISHEVFYILFNNRDLLIRFNQIVAGYVTEFDEESFDEYDKDEYWSLFKSKGRLARVGIPVWCQDAVYHREKGKCCKCGTDLSAVLRTLNKKHFDHMVPLNLGGINDVSNIQLLCSTCNLEKGGTNIETSIYYLKWYI